MTEKPQSNIAFVNAQATAQRIANSALVAYWQGESFGGRDIHDDLVHDDFAKLADLLGYDITRRDADAPLPDARFAA